MTQARPFSDFLRYQAPELISSVFFTLDNSNGLCAIVFCCKLPGAVVFEVFLLLYARHPKWLLAISLGELLIPFLADFMRSSRTSFFLSHAHTSFPFCPLLFFLLPNCLVFFFRGELPLPPPLFIRSLEFLSCYFHHFFLIVVCHQLSFGRDVVCSHLSFR